MKFISVTDSKHPLFEAAWKIYNEAFPVEERRSLQQQEHILQIPAYHFDVAVYEEKVIGILLWWDFEEMVYVDHFATDTNIRGAGLGKMILQEFMQKTHKPILLEVEPPVEEIQLRRIRFYERLDFILNDHPYQQPPYHKGGIPIDLQLMSFPRAITKVEADLFVSKYHPVIYPPVTDALSL